jgi:hypothetical protein
MIERGGDVLPVEIAYSLDRIRKVFARDEAMGYVVEGFEPCEKTFDALTVREIKEDRFR